MFARFLPLKLVPPLIHINLRNHRKLLIIDSHTGFTGGMNISQNHCIENNNEKKIQDLHFKINGPVVSDLASIFSDDWHFAYGKPIASDSFETVITDSGLSLCRAIADGPNEELDVLPMLLSGVISSARKSVIIVTPYFLPPRELLRSLQAAAMRGIEVTIVLPEKNNLSFVHWASQKILLELLRYGVKVYYQPPPFAHTKLCSIDDFYSLIGSPNFDPRSLVLNFEVVLEIYDLDVSNTLIGYTNEVLSRSRFINAEDLEQRPLVLKLRDAFFWLFSSYL